MFTIEGLPVIASWLQATLSLVSLVGFAVLGYLAMATRSTVAEIRLEQASVKAALLEQQQRTKDMLAGSQLKDREEFLGHVARLDKTFEVHSATDELNFRGIRDSLQRIETLVTVPPPPLRKRRSPTT